MVDNSKIALITGITGQDGAYLAEFLLNKGYEVHGIKRRTSLINTDRIDHIYEDPNEGETRFTLHYGDLVDGMSLVRVIEKIQPDEIYNLAAQSHVAVSFDSAEYTANVDGLGTLRLLEAIRILELEDHTRFYQASTSELYGIVQEVPQKETTPFYPRSPYAVAKLYAYWSTVNHREAYDMFACNGILFNHESPIRGETFVTRKITRAAARIALGLEECIYLGNLEAMRDWGHARDYVEAQWMILQHDEPDDFVIATGVQYSVRTFVTQVFKEMGVTIEWQGTGIEEKAIVTAVDPDVLSMEEIPSTLAIGKQVVAVHERYFRPSETDTLLGDASKAKEILGWEPKVTFEQLVKEMIISDLELANRDHMCQRNGYKVPHVYD